MAELEFSSSIDNGFGKDLKDMLKEMQKFEKSMQKSSERMEKDFNKDMDKMRSGFEAESRKMRKQIDLTNAKLKSTGDQAKKTGNSMKLAFAGVFGTAAMASFLRKTIEVRGEFEKLTIAFTASLKSKEKADRLMADIVQMAATTPFQLRDVADGAKRLMAFGESADTVLSTLSKIGDIAAGTGTDINGLSLAYGQVMTKGKLMTQEMYQFAERGVPMIAELAKVLGKEEKEIAKLVETGKVGFKDVQQVMFNLTAEGGRFFELTAEQSKTLAGQYSNLGDAIDKMFNDIGESNQGALSVGLDTAKFFVEHWEDLANVLGTVVAAYGTYKAAVMTTSAIQAGSQILKGIQLMNRLKTSIGLANAAQKAFNITAMANPYAILATAIGGLVAGLYLFIDATDDATKANEKLNETVRRRIAEEGTGLKELEERNKVAYLDKQSINSIIKDLNENYSEYLNNLVQEDVNQADVNTAIQEANKAMEANILLQEKRNTVEEERQKLADLQSEALSPDLTETIRRVRTQTVEIDGQKVDVSPIMAENLKEQADIVAKFQAEVLTLVEESNNKQADSEKVKLNTIKDLEAEIADIRLRRNTKTDISDKARLDSLQSQIDEKQKQLDALNGKDGSQTALEALDIANQQRINAITDQYGREESLAHQFNLTLLQNELDYLTDKRKLTTNELEKLKLSEQIILKDTQLSNLEDTSSIDALLDKYRTYYEKRGELTKKFTRDIVELERAGKSEQAEVAKNDFRLEIDALDKSFLAKSEAYQKYITETLPDIIKKGSEFLQGEAQQLRLKIEMEGDPKELVILNAQLDEVQDKLDGIKDKSKKTTESFKKTISDLNRVNSLIGQIGNSLAESGSDAEILISGITGSVSGIINLVGAVKMLGTQLTALEKASVILTIISATLQIANALNEVQEKNAQRVDEAKARELQANYAVNDALIEQIRLYERGNELFASDQWGTALNGLTAYNQALKQQDDLLAEMELNAGVAGSKSIFESQGSAAKRTVAENFKKDAQSRATQLERALASVKVTTKERSGIAGFFGFEDKTDQLIDLYPELIDAQGKLNALQLEEVVNKANISEADRQRLTSLQENLAQQEESYAQFGDYIAGIFGGVGDDVTQAFMDSYIQVANGANSMADASIDAMGRMEDAMSGMIENFTRDAIEFAMIQPIIDQLNQSAKDLGTEYASGVISSEALSSGIIGAIGSAYGQINNIAPEVLKAYEAADKLAEKAGFESAFSATSDSTDTTATQVATTPTSVTQISETITEATGTQMVGRMGAIMLSNERLVNIGLNMQSMGAENMVTLNAIKVNTDYLPQIAANTKKAADRLGGL